MFRKISGEEKSVDLGDTDAWLQSTLPELLADFDPKDVYNLDETGLLYRLKSDRTLDFTGKQCTGGKKSKDRLAVLVEASMIGEKLPLLVIGK